jgi:hypothetical protein
MKASKESVVIIFCNFIKLSNKFDRKDIMQELQEKLLINERMSYKWFKWLEDNGYIIEVKYYERIK